MDERTARYHLRIQLRPGPDVRRRAQVLARFCRDHDVEEVALFTAAEEWNDGFLGEAELEQWYEALRVAKEELDAAGIGASLNPWYTLLHSDRGRHQPSDWAFTPMASPTGRRTRATASVACPNWQAHIAEVYGRLARLGFRVVWIEDDFRYHNHTPLDWGGDFSTAMLGRFATRVGRDVSRDEVVAAILKPGDPHPWRALWLDTWREAQLEAAGVMRDAVVSASPGSLMGLMSSLPSSHSIEGRDWGRLFRAMGNDGKVLHRPHFAGYQDATRTALARSSFVLDYQKEIRPADLQVEVTPEIENFPMTPYSKSDTVTWGHMALAQVHGCDAQMLDIFTFAVHSIESEPWVGRFLDRVRPGLDELARLFPARLASTGVGVVWRPDASLHVRTESGTHMSELHVPLTPPADVLQSLGVAVQPRPGAVNCLWGRVAWAYPDEEIAQLLSGRLWLDAEATAILQHRGFGSHLPVAHHHWWLRDDMNYSMEHPESGDTGLHESVWLSVNGFGRVAYQTLKPGAAEWTTMCDARGKRIGWGLAVGENSLGGRVAASAWPLSSEPDAYDLSFHRQQLVQRLIAHLSPEGLLPTMVQGSAYTFPVDFRAGDARHVVVFNASLDWQKPRVRIPGARRVTMARAFTAQEAPADLAVETAHAGAGALEVSVLDAIPFCGLAVLSVV